jgi:hypothetical protein
MHALKQSADFFPPLKSVVSGAIAICEIAEVCGSPYTWIISDNTQRSALGTPNRRLALSPSG